VVPASDCLYKPIVYKHPSLSGLKGLEKGVEAHRCTALRPMIGIGIVWRSTPCSQQVSKVLGTNVLFILQLFRQKLNCMGSWVGDAFLPPIPRPCKKVT
jgi:hypothetical protein